MDPARREPRLFKFRLNCIDYYQALASSLDPVLQPLALSSKGAQESFNVPIIRIFGSTETGQKVCAHVHGAFPYLYIEYHGGLGQKEVEAHIQSLAASVDEALGLSYRRNISDGRPTSYVAHISLVKGIPFYGYHVGYRYFLKIYLRNPSHMTRFAELLQQGAILGRSLQPYESHLQYLLQWMCDYNLYGCGYVICDKYAFRAPIPEPKDSVSVGNTWNESSVSPELVLEAADFPRQSYCDLEVDIRVEDIVNRLDTQSRDIHQDFAERFYNPDGFKFVHSMATLWRDEATRRGKTTTESNLNSSAFPPEAMVTMSADPNLGRGGWIHEAELLQVIKSMMKKERPLLSSSPSFDTFLDTTKLGDAGVKTAYQSVEDLFTSNSFTLASSKESLPSNTHMGQPVTDEHPILDLCENFNESVGPTAGKRSYDNEQPSKENSVQFQSKRPKVQDKTFEDRSRMRSKLHSNASGSQSVESKANIETVEDHANHAAFTQYSSSQGPQKQISSSFPITKYPHEPLNSLSNGRLSATDQGTVVRHPALFKIGQSTGIQQLLLSKKSLTKIALGLRLEFGITEDRRCFLIQHRPPLRKNIRSALKTASAPSIIAQNAFYSEEGDVPDKPREYAGKEFRLHSISVPFLPEFDKTGRMASSRSEREVATIDSVKEKARYRNPRQHCSYRSWQIGKPPPPRQSVESWLLASGRRARLEKGHPDYWTKISRKSKQRNEEPPEANSRRPKSVIDGKAQYMSMMSLEVHAKSRDHLVPDPVEDAIQCVFWSIETNSAASHDGLYNGIILVNSDELDLHHLYGLSNTTLDIVEDELELLNRTIDLVRDADPDILVGYEVHNGSWGYLVERARLKYEFSFASEISRVRSQARAKFGRDADRWGFEHTSSISITGRHMLNVWRAVRGELNLLQYTLENAVFRVLKRRIPHYNHAKLTEWFDSGSIRLMARVINYFVLRVKLNLEILEAIDIVARTSEQARLIGVDFFSVISRGSQFKIESLMFRIAKPENYILFSPSRRQVGGQNALECLPLVMEPQSNFYPSPLLVLDFQSLYPSIMIAYNYCYSTCLGRVSTWRGRNKLGVTDYTREPGILELLKDHINVSPNGLMYVRPEIRRGILSRMLTEILETRIMVKSGMKVDKEDQLLQRLLNNRQLALKLIANVTYGYTSASFSGRMPCAEIADSIVQTARETLERSIAMIHARKDWDAEVVYGDTDSLFVYLKGRSRDEAFVLGKEIAETITKANPRPVKLKFEKVYHPCVLLAKKRYVGYKYESPDQKVPEFDAKGIETVRRDGTPFEQKIEEKALRTLFETSDLSKVKRYFQAECDKIMSGEVNIQDFLFAKEVRLGTYSENGVPPAGALIATKRMHLDARREPQYGERVPYVVVAGAPGSRLIDRCVDPGVLLNDDQAELDAEYYITKNLIPPLERIFNLVGANVRAWYDDMPKTQRLRTVNDVSGDLLKALDSGEYDDQVEKTLETFLREGHCIACHGEMSTRNDGDGDEQDEEDGDDTDDRQGMRVVCNSCFSDAPVSMHKFVSKMHAAEQKLRKTTSVCRSCSATAPADEVACDSRDCPVFYTRVKQRSTLDAMRAKTKLLTASLDVEDW